MKVLFCGGAGEVGASCILLRVGGKNLVFDSGIRMGTSGDQLPHLNLIQENGGADAIFISHAHMDHCGSLPILSREYPEAKIYMTHTTRDLIQVLLYDSLKIMESREAEIPVFAEVHVKNALDRILCFSPGYTFRPFDDISVTFYNAGHIAGAACIYVTSGEGSVFYSGDFSISPQRTVEGASVPRLRPDLAVFETTYGDRLHSNRSIEEERLVSKVNEIISSGKKVLIPAFALGRAQEVILILKRAMNKGELPAFKIYVDGMVNDICRIYMQNPNYLRNQQMKKLLKGNDIFYDENIIAVTGRQSQREEIISRSEGCCIISSSGMLTGGPSQWYAVKMAGDEGNYIALTGYQDEESPGRQLLEIADTPVEEERYLKLGDLTVPVKCGIGKFGLSAHADKTEIISLVHALGARKVFFVHGNQDVISSMANEVQKEYRSSVYAPVNGETFEFNVNNPRKQIEKSAFRTLNKGKTPANEDLPDLWEFISSNYGNALGLTLEDLFYIWTGENRLLEEEFETFSSVVNSSRYFEPEIRRPFLYHAVAPEALAKDEKDKYMEVNKMLTLVDSYFPFETGLYKKGANFDEKIALLYFNFPQAAEAKYSDRFVEFENETGWKVSVNKECNVSSAQNLIYKLFGINSNVVGKISYFPVENLFKARISVDIAEKGKIQSDFHEATGLKLVLETATSDTSAKNSPVKAAEYQVEQNEALAIIQSALENEDDRLYKRSLKVIDGQPYIELSFISPAVGERYKNLIDELESRLRWQIRINQTPNQNEIINLGRRLIEERGVVLRKNLAYMPKEMEVKAFIQSGDEAILANIETEFKRATGIDIKFISQA